MLNQHLIMIRPVKLFGGFFVLEDVTTVASVFFLFLFRFFLLRFIKLFVYTVCNILLREIKIIYILICFFLHSWLFLVIVSISIHKDINKL